MDITTVKPMLDLLVSYGVPLIITGFVIWLAWRYVPKLIDGSLESQKTIPSSINNMTDTLKEGIRIMRDVRSDSRIARDDLDKIKDALGHAAGAAEKAINHPEIKTKIPSDVIRELRAMREVTHSYEHNQHNHRSESGPIDLEGTS